jgi:hypothetical protein
MKEGENRLLVRELLQKGFTSPQIVERVPCNPSHVYRLITQEQLRTGMKPLSVDRLTRLEERVRQLEKLVATLASMKRFGGSGITQSQPETPEARLQRLTSDSELRGQKPGEGQ